MHSCLHVALLLASFAHGVALPGIRNHYWSWSDPYSLRLNPLYPPYARSSAAKSPGNISIYDSRSLKDSDVSSPSRTRRFAATKTKKFKAGALRLRPRQDASTPSEQNLDPRPTPDPTGLPSLQTTVYIKSDKDFALLLPKTPGELVSDAEMDAITYCTPGTSGGSCENRMMPDGFITAASFTRAEDDSWIQVTGCIDSSKFHFSPGDTGGQMDVRYPNGAQCTFGGQGASFIELVEPALNRFCLRCCSSPDDQVNCNSHHDRSGCEAAIPGTYDFPEIGVSCA